VSVCGDVALFGGFNVFGNAATAIKLYDSKVDHHELIFQFDLYTIDTWDNEFFKVFVDGTEVYSF